MGSDKHPFLSMSKSRSRSRSRFKSRSRSRSTNKRSSHHKHKSSRKRDDYRRRSRSNSYRSRDKRRRNQSKSRSRSRSNRRSRKDRKRNSREKALEIHNTRNVLEEPNLKENPEPDVEPEKPCFIPSGILARYTNTVNGVTLKFTEPPDAAVPTTMWRIYPFKGEEALPALHLHRQSCYLIGKDNQVADIIVENPTCSSQHAVIQFREVKKQIGEEVLSEIRPYIMDLDSKNGTFLNGEKLEPARYYQLLHKDVIKLANSTREYVIMSG